MAIKNTTAIDCLVTKALERIKRNLTDHVFWEIQRDTDLFREYVSIIAGKDCEIGKNKYRSVHSALGKRVAKAAGAKSVNGGKTGNSALNQTFTRFEPTTVKI